MSELSHIKRPLCPQCAYPQSTCLCAWIKPVKAPCELIILQHPKETNHAKNTVKLLKLGLTNLQVIQGEHPEAFYQLSQQVRDNKDHYVLCYPNQNSQAIETLSLENKSQLLANQQKAVILIDASWRKALKMWHLNPWLHELPSWHFASPPTNQYQIRQTKIQNGLSTLEAVSYLLHKVHGFDGTALLHLFEKMQSTCFAQHHGQIKT
ncbi:tRNA-uridine aminocarboxypropyltransferase [Paraglaciecola aestuariivivens]